jgi:nitroreductase
VIDGVVNRRSIRRFLSVPVPVQTVSAIRSGAARAASGTNTQPWHVHVVTDAARDWLSRAVIAATEAGDRSEEHPYQP